MKFLDLINKESTGKRGPIIAAAAVSGAANAALLAISNAAAESVDQGEGKFRMLLMFLVAISLYAVCIKYTYDRSTTVFESIMSRIRLRIARKIRASELRTVDGIGRALIYNQLTQETEVISQSQQPLVAALQAAVMVIFTSFYIAWLSLPAFALTVAMTAGAVIIFLVKDKESQQLLSRASAAQVQLLRAVTDLLDGFKQVKISDRLGRCLIEEIEKITAEVYQLKVQSTKLFNKNNIFAVSFFYVLIGAIVFILPRFIPTFGGIIHELTSAILFIIGPLGVVVGGIPTLAKANMATQSIYRLEEQLDKQERVDEAVIVDKRFFNFKKIEISNVDFAYRGKQDTSFCFGPVSLAIHRHEIMFIIGGNGSGKSTFLKLMTGLYEPVSGSIKVDGMPIDLSNRQCFRELFSVIFGDFHLFEKLYGLDVSQEVVQAKIVDMEIADKTSYDGERFTNLDLSTGQRKRLALIAAILEERPILVLDEWAADQDPIFRERFYLSILPELAASGKTIIAVTHDDHYFHLAHRVIKFDLGGIDSIRTNQRFGATPDLTGEGAT
jgi:putative pyoverdin transport system ATP-binding/permease protein